MLTITNNSKNNNIMITLDDFKIIELNSNTYINQNIFNNFTKDNNLEILKLYMDYRNNNIKNIFINFLKLKELCINYNQIHKNNKIEINEDLFNGLSNLKKLELSCIKTSKNVNNLFQEVEKEKRTLLFHPKTKNIIKNYGKNIFKYLINNLEELTLNNTSIIKNINDELKKLKKLKTLKLNNCDSFEDIPFLVNLETLHLTNFSNKSLNLNKFVNLKELYLNYKKTRYIDINKLFEIKYNVIKDNVIKDNVIKYNVIKDNVLGNLKKLTFDHCNLYFIQENFFKYLTNLEDLIILQKDNIYIAQKEMRNKYSFLSTKSINEKSIIKLNNLKKLTKLKNLSLECYLDLYVIDENTFNGLNNLENLNLLYNYITKINPSTFINLEKLKELNLSGNELEEINKDTFNGLNNLENLNLSSNKLKKINSFAFNGLNNLKNLNLSDNKLEEINKDTLNGLNNLENLNLLSNKLKKINPFAFIYLKKLKNIDLLINNDSLKNNYLNLIKNIDNIKNINKIYDLYNNLINIKIINDKNSNKINSINRFKLTINKEKLKSNENLELKKYIINLKNITDDKFKKKYDKIFDLFIRDLRFKIKDEFIKLFNITDNYINKSIINSNIFINKNNKNESLLSNKNESGMTFKNLIHKPYSIKDKNFIEKYLSNMKKSELKINYYKDFFGEKNLNNLNYSNLLTLYDLSDYLSLPNLTNILFYKIYFKIINYNIYELMEFFFSLNFENINLDKNFEEVLFSGDRDTLLNKPFNMYNKNNK